MTKFNGFLELEILTVFKNLNFMLPNIQKKLDKLNKFVKSLKININCKNLTVFKNSKFNGFQKFEFHTFKNLTSFLDTSNKSNSP